MNITKLAIFFIIGSTFIYIYGLSLLSYVFAPADIELTPLMLTLSLSINLIVLGGASIIGNILTYSINLRESLLKLYFRRKGTLYSILIGISLGIAALFLFSLIFAALSQIGYHPSENPLGEEIAQTLTAPLLLLVPLFSAVSEELFYRGFLQPRLVSYTTLPIGITITSILFGFAHLSYGNPVQIIIPMILGILFGALLVQTKNILAPISAHFTFNFIQLTVAYLL